MFVLIMPRVGLTKAREHGWGQDLSIGETSPRADVVIVGAGIAGSALRWALHLRSIPSLVLERRRDADDGLAINLPGNAIAALSALGLGDELQRHGRPIRRREYRTDRGRLLFAVDEDAFWGTERRPRCIRRSELLAMLRRDQSTDEIAYGKALTRAVEKPHEVEILLSDGSMVASRMLVGADGVRSATRHAIFGEGQPDVARLAAFSWRFMAPNPGVDCWTLWAGKEAAVLLIPVDGNEVYGWAAATRDRTTSTDPSRLSQLVHGFPMEARKAVEDAQSSAGILHHSPLEEVRLDRWGSERVVLIGDAAHATAPVWAEGAALAMEDALVLAALFEEKPDGTNISHALEARRRERVSHVQTMTDRMSRAARLPVGVRNMLLPFLGPRSYRATYEPLKTPAVAS